MLISAGGYAAGRIGQPPLYFFWKALPLMAAGVTALFFFSFLNKKQIIYISAILGAISALLVLMTLISPTCIKGSCRWITLAGFQLHPSELLKPFFIVLTATFFSFVTSRLDRGISVTKYWTLYLTITLPLLATILIRKDLGMTMIYLAVFTSMWFFSGAKLRYIFMLGAAGGGIVGAAFMLWSHVRIRIMGTGDQFQVGKALDSIRNGGFIGQSNSSFVKSDLPDSHTDFVFAAFTEDRGVIFGILLLALYFWLMFRILNLMQTIKDPMTKLVCGGTVALIAIHLLLNIGTTLNLTPAKGTILPFISYGGSAFITMCAVFGILLGLLRSYKFDYNFKKCLATKASEKSSNTKENRPT